MAGEPLSVTTIRKVFVVPPSLSLVDQRMRPVVGVSSAPAGAPGKRLKVRVCAGTSESVTFGEKEKGEPSGTVWTATAAKLGALFTADTTAVCASGEPGSSSMLPAASAARL